MQKISRPVELDREADADSVPLNQAAKYLPGNVRPSHTTWWRWWRRGVRGVRLRTWLVGGKRHTSAAAIAEWIAHVTAAGSGLPVPGQVVERPRARCVDAAAVAQLARDRI